ncbi:hypothetical protein BGW39_010836 [Mortierella sp. 14UC]|nr:hypothetical protein BGW39_010836 [Mortierella sp. 14UC]
MDTLRSLVSKVTAEVDSNSRYTQRSPAMTTVPKPATTKSVGTRPAPPRPATAATNQPSRHKADQFRDDVHPEPHPIYPDNQGTAMDSYLDHFGRDFVSDPYASPIPVAQRNNYHSEAMSQRQPESMSDNHFKNNGDFSQETKILFIGNPGVGKSALLNVFGGSFTSGCSEVAGLTQQVTNEPVVFHGRSLRLFDVPGIDDCIEDGGDDTIVKHLQMLQDTLNTGGQFVVFFVISPRQGRIEPSDYMIMKTVLDSLRQAPMVGLILTQVKPKHMTQIKSQDYTLKLLTPLSNIVESKEFMARMRPLVLVDHGEGGFSDEEKIDIMNYVFSFEPKPVLSRNMVDQVVRRMFDMTKRGFA